MCVCHSSVCLSDCFCSLINVQRIETRRNAMTALANLATDNFNKYLIPRAGVISEIIHVMQTTSDVPLLRQATRALGHLTGTQLSVYFGDCTLDVFSTSGGLKILCQLMISADPIIHRNASWIVANLTIFSPFPQPPSCATSIFSFFLSLFSLRWEPRKNGARG